MSRIASAAVLGISAPVSAATAPEEDVPCWIAECATPWGRPGGHPIDGGHVLQDEAPINNLGASGTAATEIAALSIAIDRATTPCTSGMKIVDVDTVYTGATGMYTVTMSYDCPVLT